MSSSLRMTGEKVVKTGVVKTYAVVLLLKCERRQRSCPGFVIISCQSKIAKWHTWLSGHSCSAICEIPFVPKISPEVLTHGTGDDILRSRLALLASQKCFIDELRIKLSARKVKQALKELPSESILYFFVRTPLLQATFLARMYSIGEFEWAGCEYYCQRKTCLENVMYQSDSNWQEI